MPVFTVSAVVVLIPRRHHIPRRVPPRGGREEQITLGRVEGQRRVEHVRDARDPRVDAPRLGRVARVRVPRPATQTY